MEAVWQQPSAVHGPPRLIEHFGVLERLDDARPSAVDRLQRALGDEFARLLLRALAGQPARFGGLGD